MRNAAFIALLLTACASANHWHPYAPASGHTTRTITDAQTAIVNAGYEVDSTTGNLVASRWFKGNGFGAEENEFRLTVNIENGDYTIDAQCRATTSTGACGDRRPQFVLDAMAKVEEGLR